MTLPPSACLKCTAPNVAASGISFSRTAFVTSKELQQPACFPQLPFLHIYIPNIDSQPILINGPNIRICDVLDSIYSRLQSVLPEGLLRSLSPEQMTLVKEAFQRRCHRAADYYRHQKGGMRLCDLLLINTHFKGLKASSADDQHNWSLYYGSG